MQTFFTRNGEDIWRARPVNRWELEDLETGEKQVLDIKAGPVTGFYPIQMPDLNNFPKPHVEKKTPDKLPSKASKVLPTGITRTTAGGYKAKLITTIGGETFCRAKTFETLEEAEKARKEWQAEVAAKRARVKQEPTGSDRGPQKTPDDGRFVSGWDCRDCGAGPYEKRPVKCEKCGCFQFEPVRYVPNKKPIDPRSEK